MAKPKSHKVDVAVMSYFRIRGGSSARWKPEKSYPVKRAELTILDPNNNTSLTTATMSKWGTGSLDVTNLADGTYTLKVSPQTGEISTMKAGPNFTALAGAKYMYRSIDLKITIASHKITKVDLKTSGEIRGSGKMLGGKLKIDLKPDWMRCNSNGRGGKSVDMIVIHHTGGKEIGTALNTFLKKHAPHYVLDVDGHLVKTVDGTLRGSHAGHSRWNGDKGVNDISIGIEIVHKSGAYDAAQYTSLIPLLKRLCQVHGIPKHHIVGHDDVGTAENDNFLIGRKGGDPGPNFDWAKLTANGLGLQLTRPSPDGAKMYDGVFAPKAAGKLDKKSSKKAIVELQSDLENIGYSLKQTGAYDKWTQAAVKQFQLHFDGSSGGGLSLDQATATKIKRCTTW